MFNTSKIVTICLLVSCHIIVKYFSLVIFQLRGNYDEPNGYILVAKMLFHVKNVVIK
jgi:hypothetical protein